MPCRDYTPDNCGELHILQQKIDTLTNLLCEACSLLDDSNAMSPALLQWFDKHVEADRKEIIHQVSIIDNPAILRDLLEILENYD
jgi:hypothetical protein